MNRVYLLLGGNMGDVQKSFKEAIRQIRKNIGKLQRQSSIYKTAAWGLREQADFLNCVLVVDTKLTPTETLSACLEIEKNMGRKRKEKNAARNIDIDILFFNKEIINTGNLNIPHPRLTERRFTLVPLNEVSPQFKHPVFQSTLHQLLLNCPDDLTVEKI